MAILASIASGNFTAAATWGLVDATSYLGGETAAEIITTAYSGTRSAAFTPGAITISHIGVKLAVRTGTTGTISVNLELDSDNSQVAGTEVTINVADLPVAATADANGGWHFFKLAAPVTLIAATAYQVAAKTSSASQVSLFRGTATPGDLSRALITTTTQAPVAGDDTITAGEYTGAGTSNSFTVTMNETATTDYGSAPTAANSLLTPGIAICNKGTLTWGTTAATNYNLKLSNSIIVYSGGTLNMGTIGGECPRNSTMTLQFDPGTNVDYGLVVRNLGTWNAQGLSRTSGKNIVSCYLNTDEAINSMSLGVDTDTGWLDNDVIAIATTTRTAAQCETGTLNGNAGASTLTVDGFAGAGGGLAFAHSGTSPTQAEVILLTRNIVIRGASSTLQAYVRVMATAVVDIDWTEFMWLGSNTSNKKGIDVETTTGSFVIEYSSLNNFIVTGCNGITITSSTGSGIDISNNCFYNINSNHIGLTTATSGSYTIDNNVMIRSVVTNTGIVSLVDVGGIFTNNKVAGSAGYGILLAEANTLGTFSTNTSHGNGSTGFAFNSAVNGGVVDSCTTWRNTGHGIATEAATRVSNVTFLNCIAFGNTTTISSGNSFGNFYNVTFDGLISNGDSSFATNVGVQTLNAPTVWYIHFKNCNFGTASGIKVSHATGDISTSPAFAGILRFENCILASATEVSGTTLMVKGAIVSSQRHDQTAGLHKLWRYGGLITIETVTTQAGGHSMKMTPSSASIKLESSGEFGGFKVQVANGQTCTPTVYVYEDASYNGARARLIVKQNYALGITADTVLDTATAASDGAWEALTGTTAAVTDDGVLEFVVDCDGTAGNLFVDTFSATVT